VKPLKTVLFFSGIIESDVIVSFVIFIWDWELVIGFIVAVTCVYPLLTPVTTPSALMVAKCLSNECHSDSSVLLYDDPSL
jgi:hypothetical protein